MDGSMTTAAVFPPAAESVELAQASPAAGEAIGQVSAVEGSVTITHADGSKVAAAAGTPIFQGDLVETKDTGAVGITFADESTFSLADNGAMVIDQMVYDPSSQKGSSAITVAQGVFTFVSGQIAKTDVDAMLIKTPVAVIGIRGTAGGGKAGPEGTPNTYSMFADPKTGVVGEMTIKTQGGFVIFNQPLQTTQISSSFVPPLKPIVLPASVAQQFYSKATTMAPTKPVFGAAPTLTVTGGTLAGATGDPAAAGAAGGPTGAAGGPTGAAGGPGTLTITGGTLAPGGADDAAGAAFANALAAGGSLDAAIGAAVNTATGLQIQGALQFNPNAFGSVQSGQAIMNAIADKVTLGVTGNFDMMGAGTGGSAGFTAVTGNFFTNAVGDAIGGGLNEVGGVLASLGIGGGAFNFGGQGFGPGGGLFGPGPGFGPGGPGFGPEFGPGFGDPFAFGPGFGDAFFDPFGFGFLPPPGFDTFFETTFVGIFTEIITTQGTIQVFDEFINGTLGNDALLGTGLNTQITMVQGSSLGGTDTVNGGGGIDELFLGNLSDIDFIYHQTSSPGTTPIVGTINYSGAGGTVTGSMSLTSIEQISFSDGASGFQRLAFESTST
ncbi:MAG TPA: FecR domain-containing protein, partial [Rhodospirillales bacterium]